MRPTFLWRNEEHDGKPLIVIKEINSGSAIAVAATPDFANLICSGLNKLFENMSKDQCKQFLLNVTMIKSGQCDRNNLN